ncbi:MerR family transcriptional regulator [Plantactinospora mayteni]|uniref:MerR family transcriptional regulator n=1 Tax=Plantactinospora mayteni TaxID=566021 RepID=A0ABQ4EYI8_9ACTN|nr:MerR family transcriptional regulator [Plantactinospora mayteni]GIG99679.1 MerR family transcriptional regulator [Plantactinospora mayteni]
MLIGELSRQTGVNTHQLRYYEAQGLIEPARGSSGYREYGTDDVVTVTQIRRLLEAGLSTQEIGFLLPCATGSAPDLEPCPELLDTLRARLHGLDDRIDTLARSRETLADYISVTEKRVSTYLRSHDAGPPEPAAT